MEIRLQDARVDRMREIGFPFVTIGRIGHPEGTAWVDLDHRTLVRRCVQHLSDLGHRQLAFVNRSEALVRAGYESAHRGQDGFEVAVRELGLTGAAYPCDDDAMGGKRCAERMSAGTEPLAELVLQRHAIAWAAAVGRRRAVARRRGCTVDGVALMKN